MINSQKEMYQALCDGKVLVFDKHILYKFINDVLHIRYDHEDSCWDVCSEFPNNHDKIEIYTPPLWWQKSKHVQTRLKELLRLGDDVRIHISPVICWVSNNTRNKELDEKSINSIALIDALVFDEVGSFLYYVSDERSFKYALPLSINEVNNLCYGKQIEYIG
ncbi:MAG: hypothetical protein WC679_01075 [Bacteroidales bacterium]|jgi:hypothetical protein